MKKDNNLMVIYGIDLVAFGIVLALHLSIEKFDFNDYWCLFLTIPAVIDIVLNKLNIVNGSLLVISASLLGYFIFNTLWASVVIFVILIGLILIFGRKLSKKSNNK